MAMHQPVYQHIREKENMQDQRKLKIATLAISVDASRVMYLKIKAVDTTNL